MKSFTPLLLMLAGLPLPGQPMEHTSMSRSVAPPSNERLGTVSLPISCAAGSQAAFNRGVALLHDFWYEEARSQFDQIVKSDPGCAIAHWGLAMSVFHQIWNHPDAADMKLGAAEMKKAKALKASTARERGYIDALAGFFVPGRQAFPARIQAYSSAMAKLYARFPDDADAGAFYALSLMAAAAPGDTTLGQSRKAMKVLTPLFARFPDHPGLVHYTIHACDNPAMAADGLAAANHYGGIAWSGAHAFHMPGHIYSRLGLWPQDIASQLGSIAASEAAEARGANGLSDEPHSYDFLLYAYLQSGLDARAKAALDQVSLLDLRIKAMPEMQSGHMDMVGMVPHYQAFYALEMRDWKAATALEPVTGSLPEVAAEVYWARALADGRLHDAKRAAADLARFDELMTALKKSEHGYLTDGVWMKMLRGEMVAWAAFAEGKQDEAVKTMRMTADLQDQVGQGEVDIPAREMLADMLLEFGLGKEALAEYGVALKLSPNRLNGLYNAGRAAEAAGEKGKAKGYYEALLKVTHNGENSARPDLAHAREFVANGRY